MQEYNYKTKFCSNKGNKPSLLFRYMGGDKVPVPVNPEICYWHLALIFRILTNKLGHFVRLMTSQYLKYPILNPYFFLKTSFS